MLLGRGAMLGEACSGRSPFRRVIGRGRGSGKHL